MFKRDYSDRRFRIHNLPESKRYAENDAEWKILLSRQNKTITFSYRNAITEVHAQNNYHNFKIRSTHCYKNLSNIL
jgi:hypothetical protein